MGGFAADHWVATSRGVIPLKTLDRAMTMRDLVQLRLSDGSRLRCTPDQLLHGERGWVRVDALTTSDRLIRPVGYVARSDCPEGLPEAAREIATKPSLDLPLTWSESFAHYLGWLVGDGNFSHRGAVTIYGTEDEISQTMREHQLLLTSWAGFRPKPSIQANGTVQLRLMRHQLVGYLSALGVAQKTSAEKVVPAAVFSAPEEALTAFLRGLFDADGCVVNQLAKGTRYVGLGSKSQHLLLGVQALLASLGIVSRIYRTAHKSNSFRHVRKDGTEVVYSSSGPSFDLRIAGRSLREFAVLVDFGLKRKQLKLLALVDDHDYYDVAGSVAVRAIEFDRGPSLTVLVRAEDVALIVG